MVPDPITKILRQTMVPDPIKILFRLVYNSEIE